MKIIAFILVSAGFFTGVFAQEQVTEKPSFPRYNIGFGGGIDYGGFGGRFTILPADQYEFFAGFGYNLLGLGFNVGADYRFRPMSRVCPFAGVMYGYNAVIVITGAEQYNKT